MANNPVNKRILLKTSFWYTVSMFLTRGMVFLTMPIFTRLMSKAEYGDFSVFNTWQTILLIICSVEVYSTLNRARFDFPEKKDLNAYISSSLVLCTVITGGLFALYLIFPHIFDRFFLLDKKYMMIMFAYLFAAPALTMFQTKQRIEYRYKTSTAISMTVTLLSPVLAICLVWFMDKDLSFYKAVGKVWPSVDGDRLFYRILGQFMLHILVGLAFYVFFLSRSRRISPKYWKYALRIGLPLVFSYLGSRILLAGDTLVVKHMCSAEDVGSLSVAHSTGHIILILVQTLNNAWAPWFYDMLKVKNNGEIRKTFRLYLWVIIFCTFGVLMLGPELIRLLGSGRYPESVYILPANILCGVFTVLSAQFGNLETYYKKPEYSATITGIVAVVNVGLNILGVKLWGYTAVCYVTVLCQLILVAMHYFATRNMEIRALLPLKTLIPALGASLLLIPVSLLLYQNNIVRFVFIGVVAVVGMSVVVLKRKELMKLARKFLKKKKPEQTTPAVQSAPAED